MAVKHILLFTSISCLLNCIETKNMEGYVVGGELSKIEDFPHAVYISINCNNRTSSCGASIINQQLLLTAAHCIYKCNDTFKIAAYAGSVVKYEGSKTNVSSFKVHEEYEPLINTHDIAMMKLEEDLTFGTKVQRVALMKEPLEYKTGVVAGWGWIDSIGTRDKLLKHVRQELMDATTCSSKIGQLPVGTMCGRELTGESYPEKGDSGSALLTDNSIQIGIVSFKRRSYSNETIVYAYVPYYYDWIVKTAMELSCTDDENVLS